MPFKMKRSLTLSSKMEMKHVIRSNVPCIIGIVNEKDKKIYITYSSKYLYFLYNLVSDITNRRKYRFLYDDLNANKLDIIILEDLTSSKYTTLFKEDVKSLYIRYKCDHYVDHYHNTLGYTLYSSYNPLDLTLHRRWLPNYTLEVSLITRRFKRYFLKSFKNMMDYSKFRDTHTMEQMIIMLDEESSK